MRHVLAYSVLLLLTLFVLVTPSAAQSVEAGPPILEGWAGFYQSFSAICATGTYAAEEAWHGNVTLRTPAWKGLRAFGQAETASQDGQLAATQLPTWNGAELTLGVSWDGFKANDGLTIAPAIAGGFVTAIGADRDQIAVTPAMAAFATWCRWAAASAASTRT